MLDVCVYEQGWLRVLARQAFSRPWKALLILTWPDLAQNLPYGRSNIRYQPPTEGSIESLPTAVCINKYAAALTDTYRKWCQRFQLSRG